MYAGKDARPCWRLVVVKHMQSALQWPMELDLHIYVRSWWVVYARRDDDADVVERLRETVYTTPGRAASNSSFNRTTERRVCLNPLPHGDANRHTIFKRKN